MATLQSDVGSPYSPPVINLANALTGSVPSTHILDRGGRTGPVAVDIITTVGGSPTATFALEVSNDGVNWLPCPYSDSATPTTLSVATFVITTATTVRKYLAAGYPWRYFRVNVTANTNVTFTINVTPF